MPEGGKQPFHKPCSLWSVLPFFIVAADGVGRGSVYVCLQKSDDFGIFAVEHDFVLVAETAVVHIGRTEKKTLFINQYAFGVK